MNADVAHAQVIVAQGQSVLENLIELHGDALGLVLPREAQQVLHNAVSALSLLIKLVGIFDALRRQLTTGDEQLAISQNGRSEEHTSELQSHLNLVCRLLLEKKK